MVRVTILFFVMFFSTIVVSGEPEKVRSDPAEKTEQRQNFLVQLPQDVLKHIMAYLYANDLAHFRQTCRYLRGVHLSSKINVQKFAHQKEEHAFWDNLYKHVALYIGDFYSKYGKEISLNLSGNRVSEFMFAHYPECQYIKKLSLVGCDITQERDNFFEKSVWCNLRVLDLSNNFLALRDGDLSKSADWYSGADIWPSLCSLPKLSILSLRNNKLGKLPQEIFTCKKLRLLDVRENHLLQDDLIMLKESLPDTDILFDPQFKL